MSSMLHVTNGESAVYSLKSAGIQPAIAWRDVLHEGPVPAGLSADQLCDVRARFLAEWGGGEQAPIAAEMRARDAALLAADQVTLWFEHDLYDQLQLVQILSMLDGRSASLAQADTFIGPMGAEDVRVLAGALSPVTAEQYEVARRAWAAFRSPDAEVIPKLLQTDTSCHRHLRAALERLLEERPGSADGLSRTERQILQAVSSGATSFAEVFKRTQAMEEAMFAGDSQVMLSAQRLADCAVPLLEIDVWRLTEAGRSVLAGTADHRKLNRVDRWLGGMRFVS